MLCYGELNIKSRQPFNESLSIIRAVPTEDLQLVGLAVYGPRNDVDKVLKGLSLHP